MGVMKRAYRTITGALEWPAAPFVRALAGAGAGGRAGRLPRVSGGAWIHAASAGEVRGIVTLARQLSAAADVLITAHTAAGLRAVETLLPAVARARAPFDFPRAARRAFESADPALLLVAETEIWPNLFDAAARRRIPLVLVNARISDRTIGRYRLLGSLMRPLLARVAAVAAQTEQDAARFAALGVPAERIAVTGNMKHDLAGAETAEGTPWPGDSPLVVLGSLREGEEEPLAEALSRVAPGVPGLRIVAAPRHRNRRAAVGRAFHARGFPLSFRSEGGPRPGDTVLVLDTMGELNAFYAAAGVAFVGGTWEPFGGHNVVEPAHFGVPVIHGPFTANCALEAEALDRFNASAVVSTLEDLAAAFRLFLTDADARGQAAAGARQALGILAGSTRRTLDFLERRGVPALRRGD